MPEMSWEGGLQDNDRQAGRAEPAKETEDQRHRGKGLRKQSEPDSREMSRQWQKWGGQREREKEKTVVEAELGSQGESGQKVYQG